MLENHSTKTPCSEFLSLHVFNKREGVALLQYITLKFQVAKKYVDSFEPGKAFPRCQLRVEAKISRKKRKISSLTHQVNLKGAKFPNNILTLELPPKGMACIYTFSDSS